MLRTLEEINVEAAERGCLWGGPAAARPLFKETVRWKEAIPF